MALNVPLRNVQARLPEINLALGALRTILEYMAVVMGGTAVLVSALRGLRIVPTPAPGIGMVASVFSGVVVFAELLTGTWSVWPVLAWVTVAVLLFVCARIAKRIHDPLNARLTLASISGVLSAGVATVFSPAFVSVAFTVALGFLVSQAFTAFCAGIMGCIFGFLLLPGVRLRALNVSPMHWGHWIAATVWILFASLTWAHLESDRHKIQTAAKDPHLNLVYARWIPDDFAVREEPISREYPDRYLTDHEIEELRAAGLTGVIHGLGGQGSSPPNVRFVVVMARPDRDTVDLPKPASGDILYLQTQEGWRRFPASAPTIARTVRLMYFGPDAYFSLPTMRPHVDIGLGHPDPKSHPGAWMYVPTDWPENWQMMPPSLPQGAPNTTP